MELTLIQGLAWALALSSGIMAGVYLAFSSFIMRAFASLGTAQAIASMNAINRVILKSSFMPLFFGSSIIAVVMVITALWNSHLPHFELAFSAGLTYAVGMFAVTAAGNVPLNNALDAVSGEGAEATDMWQRYLRAWTRWNTLRAVACVVTLVLCIAFLSWLPCVPTNG